MGTASSRRCCSPTGADVNARAAHDLGSSPLLCTIMGQDVAAVTMLLDHGAGINETTFVRLGPILPPEDKDAAMLPRRSGARSLASAKLRSCHRAASRKEAPHTAKHAPTKVSAVTRRGGMKRMKLDWELRRAT